MPFPALLARAERAEIQISLGQTRQEVVSAGHAANDLDIGLLVEDLHNVNIVRWHGPSILVAINTKPGEPFCQDYRMPDGVALP